MGATVQPQAYTADDVRREMVRREVARRRMSDFARYIEPKYSVEWFHRIMDRALDRIVSGECKRLMIFTQPRVGKSVRVSEMLPAKYWAAHPDRHILHGFHSISLGRRMVRNIKRRMRSKQYAQLFPHVSIAGAREGGTDTTVEFTTNHGGEYQALGVGSAAHGRGGHLIIIDDPLRSRAEAESETIRDNIWDWYVGDVYSRQMDDDAAIVVMHTRFHEDDLAGRLLQQMADGGEQWEVLSLPSICEEENKHPEDPRKPGEPLWPSKFGLDFLNAVKSQSPRDFASLYQQRPTPDEGDIFQRSWFRYYHIDARGMVDLDGRIVDQWRERRFATMDLAYDEKKRDDYTVICVWGFNGTDLYLLDVKRGKMQAPEFIKLAGQVCQQHRVGRMLVEEVGTQKGYLQLMRQAGIPAIGVNPGREDKQARAYSVATWFAQGKVWFPATATWLGDLEHEMLSFPNSTHDDQVDAIVYGVREAFGRSQGISVATGAGLDGLSMYGAGRGADAVRNFYG